MDVYRSFIQDKVSDLDLHKPIVMDCESSIQSVINELSKSGRGSVLIQKGGHLRGIFTERDVLLRVFGADIDCSQPVCDLMTANPTIVNPNDNLSDVVKKMRQGGYRHLPVMDDDGHPVGVLSIKHVVKYLVDHFPEAIYNLPPDPDQKPVTREGA
jgi:CBS domain-containing protein